MQLLVGCQTTKMLSSLDGGEYYHRTKLQQPGAESEMCLLQMLDMDAVMVSLRVGLSIWMLLNVTAISYLF